MTRVVGSLRLQGYKALSVIAPCSRRGHKDFIGPGSNRDCRIAQSHLTTVTIAKSLDKWRERFCGIMQCHSAVHQKSKLITRLICASLACSKPFVLKSESSKTEESQW